MTARAVSYLHPGHGSGTPFERIVLDHHGRHLRRKTITLPKGEKVLVDLPEAIALGDGDVLVLEDGRLVEIGAANENLYAVDGRDARHLTELAWHIGNRHLAAEIQTSRILIERDHVLRQMLEGLGATVTEVTEPFEPVRGAYHAAFHFHP
ncbi:MAG: urease accessory protein UreE [Cucumibacter sp.]